MCTTKSNGWFCSFFPSSPHSEKINVFDNKTEKANEKKREEEKTALKRVPYSIRFGWPTFVLLYVCAVCVQTAQAHRSIAPIEINNLIINFSDRND